MQLLPYRFLELVWIQTERTYQRTSKLQESSVSFDGDGQVQLQLVYELETLKAKSEIPGTRRTERMSKSDGSTLGIDFLMIQSQRLNTVRQHTRKSLINLKSINIILRQSTRSQKFGDRIGRTNPHNP